MYLNTNLSISHLPTASASSRVTRDAMSKGVATLVQLAPPISTDKGDIPTDGGPVATNPAAGMLRVTAASRSGATDPGDYNDWVNSMSQFRTQATRKPPQVELPKTALEAADGKTAPPPLPVPASKSVIASGGAGTTRVGMYGAFFDHLFSQS